MKDHERNMDEMNGKTIDGSLFFFIGRWLERYILKIFWPKKIWNKNCYFADVELSFA